MSRLKRWWVGIALVAVAILLAFILWPRETHDQRKESPAPEDPPRKIRTPTTSVTRRTKGTVKPTTPKPVERPDPPQGNAVLFGRVTDPEGKPLKDVKIECWIEGDDGTREPVTDANGDYRRDDLKPGLLEITVFGYGHRIVRETITLNEGENRFDWTLGKGDSIGGRVTDENGEPVSGINVEIFPPGDDGDQMIVAYATTDKNGTYRARGLASGRYDVVIVDENFEYIARKDVPSGSDNVDFTVQALCELTVIVTATKEMMSIFAGNELNISIIDLDHNTTIEKSYHEERPEERRIVRQISGIHHGKHSILVAGHVFDGNPQFAPVEEVIEIRRGERKKTVSLALAKHEGYRVVGRIVASATGQPISATVTIDYGNSVFADYLRQHASVDGFFEFVHLPFWKGTLRVTHPDFCPKMISFDPHTLTGALTISLDSGGTVRGSIVNAYFDFGASSELSITSPDGKIEKRRAIPVGTNDFPFSGLPPGKYTLAASFWEKGNGFKSRKIGKVPGDKDADEWEDAGISYSIARTITVSGEEVQEVNLDASARGVLDFTIDWDRALDKKVNGIVRLTGDDFSAQAYEVIIVRGEQYRIEHIPAGTFVFEVRATIGLFYRDDVTFEKDASKTIHALLQEERPDDARTPPDDEREDGQ